SFDLRCRNNRTAPDRGALRRRNVLAAVPQHTRHPNQFVEEFRSPSDKFFIKQFSLLAEDFADRTKIYVIKDSNKPELTHHRKQRLDYARAAERTSRNAANPDGFVDVFFEIHIERMLQQPRIAMIIFRHHQNYSVGASHEIGETRIL